MEKEIQVHFHAHRADDIFTAIRLAKEFGLDYVIVHGTEGHLIADELKEEQVRILSGPFLSDRSKQGSSFVIRRMENACWISNRQKTYIKLWDRYFSQNMDGAIPLLLLMRCLSNVMEGKRIKEENYIMV